MMSTTVKKTKSTSNKKTLRKTNRKVKNNRTKSTKVNNKAISNVEEVVLENPEVSSLNRENITLSVAKVKNVISNYSLNREIFELSNILSGYRVWDEDEDEDEDTETSFSFSLDSLSDLEREKLDVYVSKAVWQEKAYQTKTVLSSWSSKKRESYSKAKREALVEFQQQNQLFNHGQFDIVSFNESFDKNFYKGFQVTDISSLKDEDLYLYLSTLLSKNKIRFNSKSKVCITAFVEHVLYKLIENGIRQCVDSKKKIIKLEHSLNLTNNNETYMLINTLPTYTTINKLLSEDQSDDLILEELTTRSSGFKHHFKYYVAEMCKKVKHRLSLQDSSVKTPEESIYSKTSVSKLFKLFCSSLAIDLLVRTGELLKTEILSRNIKTVNCNVVCTTLDLFYMVIGLDNTEMRSHVQLFYNNHNLLSEEKRTLKKN